MKQGRGLNANEYQNYFIFSGSRPHSFYIWARAMFINVDIFLGKVKVIDQIKSQNSCRSAYGNRFEIKSKQTTSQVYETWRFRFKNRCDIFSRF